MIRHKLLFLSTQFHCISKWPKIEKPKKKKGAQIPIHLFHPHRRSITAYVATQRSWFISYGRPYICWISHPYWEHCRGSNWLLFPVFHIGCWIYHDWLFEMQFPLSPFDCDFWNRKHKSKTCSLAENSVAC